MCVSPTWHKVDKFHYLDDNCAVKVVHDHKVKDVCMDEDKVAMLYHIEQVAPTEFDHNGMLLLQIQLLQYESEYDVHFITL